MAVPPRARSPAAASARTSACGPPAYAWKPSPTMAPEVSRMTHPTTGFGLVVPRPLAARSMARRIARSSTAARPSRSVTVPPLLRLAGPVVRAGCRAMDSARGVEGRRRCGRHAARDPQRPRAVSHPDCHRRLRSHTGSTGSWLPPGRGLADLPVRSPPVRICTESRQRAGGYAPSVTRATGVRVGPASHATRAPLAPRHHRPPPTSPRPICADHGLRSMIDAIVRPLVHDRGDRGQAREGGADEWGPTVRGRCGGRRRRRSRADPSRRTSSRSPPRPARADRRTRAGPTARRRSTP